MNNVSFKKKIKGEYGYLNYQPFFSTLKTILMFALALLIFAGGYLYYGNKENIVTVLSVLTLLPSCHMLVICIMYWRFSTRSEKIYKINPNSNLDYEEYSLKNKILKSDFSKKRDFQFAKLY